MPRTAVRRPPPGTDLDARALGRAIAAARRLRKEKQITLAMATGVSAQAVQAWEQGRNLVSLRNLLRIAEVLDVPAWRLLQRAEGYRRVLSVWQGRTSAPGRTAA